MENPTAGPARAEQLVRIKLNDGSHIDFLREKDGVNICHKDFCVHLPDAPGHTTLELFALLEPLGESVVFPPDEPIQEEAKSEL